MKHLMTNEHAVSVTLEYILFSLMFIALFILLQMNFGDMLNGPKDLVIENDFNDIGNMISTLVTDMYLILPENGIIESEYMIPSEVGGESYMINANSVMTDQIFELESASGKKTSVTISGIATAININGTVSSSSTHHRIRYDSRK
ncbi:hypothetical protein [uncultured Methanomethylovorans sp.]|uniref:hypothetical protein n=1 Tax=uncultured Methanomethylovorans sp. TaxID=183759 RepID=UPI002AA759A3|nr:hypothetical protein [uncultured Methanomethylovorans sp.]